MKHVDDARLLRTTIFDNLEKANLPYVSIEEKRRLLHVVIVGGGPTGGSSAIAISPCHPAIIADASKTGVEITAELTDLAQGELKHLYPAIAPYFRITICDVADHILGAYDKKLYEYATEHMRAKGIEVATETIIEEVDNENLHIKGKQPVRFGILLWAAGNQSVPFIHELDAKKTQHGLCRVLTNEHLLMKKRGGTDEVYSNIFALGDAADVDGCSLPTTAEVALQKARLLVQQLNNTPHGSSLRLLPFDYVQKRLVTYIGSHDGITQGSPTDTPYSAYKAWLSWRSGSFTWSRTWRSWANVGWAMATNYVFGKSLVCN